MTTTEPTPSTYSTPTIILILERAARRLGMDLEILDPASRLLARIGSNGKSRLFHGGRSPLNDAVSSRVAEDKYYTTLILAEAGFRVPRTVRCLKPGHFTGGTYGLIAGSRPGEEALGEIGPPVVVKPNRMSFGRFISVVRTVEDMERALQEVWAYDYLALVQEMLPGTDYRLDYLDGEFLAGYVRRPVSIEGDGRSTIRRLVEDVDPRFENDVFWVQAQRFADWRALVLERGWTQETVLPRKERIVLGSDILNLNRFAVAEAIFEVPAPWVEFGRRIAEVTGLRHLGVDFKIDGLDCQPDAAEIIEVNASPVLVQLYRMGYEEEVIEAYAKLLRLAF